jgi:hypothetical protein
VAESPSPHSARAGATRLEAATDVTGRYAATAHGRPPPRITGNYGVGPESRSSGGGTCTFARGVTGDVNLRWPHRDGLIWLHLRLLQLIQPAPDPDYPVLALAVGLDNPDARRLHGRLGCRLAPWERGGARRPDCGSPPATGCVSARWTRLDHRPGAAVVCGPGPLLLHGATVPRGCGDADRQGCGAVGGTAVSGEGWPAMRRPGVAW